MGVEEQGAGRVDASADKAKTAAAGETQLQEQDPLAGQKYPAHAGKVNLMRQLDELEPDRLVVEEAELLPGFWRRLPGVVTTTLQSLVNWGRQNSLWYYPIGTACCAIEGLMAAGATRFDLDRHGMVPWFSPRQCDVMIVAGTVTEKMAPAIKLIYEQMPEPRYVIAVGGCAINGGPFYQGYNVVDGVDKIIPVDVYVPGCPPRPEAVIHGIYMLREKIARAGKERLR